MNVGDVITEREHYETLPDGSLIHRYGDSYPWLKVEGEWHLLLIRDLPGVRSATLGVYYSKVLRKGWRA